MRTPRRRSISLCMHLERPFLLHVFFPFSAPACCLSPRGGASEHAIITSSDPSLSRCTHNNTTHKHTGTDSLDHKGNKPHSRRAAPLFPPTSPPTSSPHSKTWGSFSWRYAHPHAPPRIIQHALACCGERWGDFLAPFFDPGHTAIRFDATSDEGCSNARTYALVPIIHAFSPPTHAHNNTQLDCCGRRATTTTAASRRQERRLQPSAYQGGGTKRGVCVRGRPWPPPPLPRLLHHHDGAALDRQR